MLDLNLAKRSDRAPSRPTKAAPTIFVQIACYNEEATIATVIQEVREACAALEDVRILVIDDGCRDGTEREAIAAGADYIARHHRNEGLANAYMTGVAAALNLGADIIVNTDGDNQYDARGIPNLIQPILDNRADLVVGARPIQDIDHFSPLKKWLQAAGSRVVSRLSGVQVSDVTSGFRALSRDAAIQLNVFSRFSYTLETLIQAGRSGLRVETAPVEVNPPTRPSRLFKSMLEFLQRAGLTIIWMFTVYAPFRSYFLMSLPLLAVSAFLGGRYAFLVAFVDPTRSHAPSLIAAAVLAVLAFGLWAVGILGELISVTRRQLEELRADLRRRNAEAGCVRSARPFTLVDLTDDSAEAEPAAADRSPAALRAAAIDQAAAARRAQQADRGTWVPQPLRPGGQAAPEQRAAAAAPAGAEDAT